MRKGAEMRLAGSGRQVQRVVVWGQRGKVGAKWLSGLPKYNSSYKAKKTHTGQSLLADRQGSKGRAPPRRDFSPHNSISKSTIPAPAWPACRQISKVCRLFPQKEEQHLKLRLFKMELNFLPGAPSPQFLGHSSPVPLFLHFSALVND